MGPPGQAKLKSPSEVYVFVHLDQRDSIVCLSKLDSSMRRANLIEKVPQEVREICQSL